MQLTTRQQINKLHEQLTTHVPLNGVRIFGYDHYPAVYDRPASTSLADMLWAVIDAAEAAGDFSPVLELLKYHHRTAYENFMAWLEETGPAETSASPPRSPGQPLSFKEKQALIQALLACGAIKDRGRRNTVIGNLPAGLQQTLIRSDVALDEVTSLVNACENYPDGWTHLLELLEFFEQGSLPFQQVRALLRS